MGSIYTRLDPQTDRFISADWDVLINGSKFRFEWGNIFNFQVIYSPELFGSYI